MNKIEMAKAEVLISFLDKNKELRLSATDENSLKQIEEIEKKINYELSQIYVN